MAAALERRDNYEPQGILLASERLQGPRIERQLIQIAAVGGSRLNLTPEQERLYGQSERYATNRLALTDADHAVRKNIIAPLMKEAGMAVREHPLGLLGFYAGSDPILEPVVVLSHTDTVPNGDMYDGVLGVVAGIAAVGAMHEANLRPRRSIIVLSLTGEESSRFNMALWGSRGMFHGLTNEELSSQKPGDITLQEALGQDIEKARIPFFGPNGNEIPKPFAAIELHVDQTGLLERRGKTIAVVDNIAAPQRHLVTVGDNALPLDTTEYPYEQHLTLSIVGHADHSGATPMGVESRADGLVKAAELLTPLLIKQEEGNSVSFSVGDIHIPGQAMNKIPGETNISIKVGGNSKEELEKAIVVLENYMLSHNESLNGLSTPFDESPIQLQRSDGKGKRFFKQPEMRQRQLAAFQLISAVSEEATLLRKQNVVGTIGTFAVTSDGRIQLGMDVRGIELSSRDALMRRLDALSYAFTEKLAPVELGSPLPGSGEPQVLDPRLVKKASEVADKLEISHEVTFSAAGHDAQNVARAGIPTVMLFAPSEYGGIAHNPNAYTSPQSIENSAKTLAALVWEVANEN